LDWQEHNVWMTDKGYSTRMEELVERDENELSAKEKELLREFRKYVHAVH
jgi:hypothetical protein